jgi:membrane fusion protein (multidrug efflux system)
MPTFRLILRSSIIFGVVLAAMAAASIWLIDRADAVYTSDARVRANMVAISADIAGRIVDLPASAGDHIAKGGVLARLDDREARLVLASLSLDLKAIEAEIDREKLRAGLSKAMGENRVGSREAGLAAARADLSAAQALLETAEAEFSRTSSLKASGLVTQSTMDRSAAQFETARQSVARARAGVAQNEADIGTAEAEAGEAQVIARNVDVLSLKAHALRQQIALQKVELQQHAILSPISGVVDEVFADEGEYLSPGGRIALAHDDTNLWIEANIKETEIARVREGAFVEAWFDAAPSRTCRGHIDRIRSAAAAEFALIPNANPTGVFTKITQRVPVRIVLDAACGELRPGAMATLKIRTDDSGS